MSRQYLAVEFRPGGRRYTYANDGEPVAIGELIKVEVRGAIKVVTVAELVIEEPPYETKPIIGKARSLDDGAALAGPDLATQAPPTFGGDS